MSCWPYLAHVLTMRSPRFAIVSLLDILSLPHPSLPCSCLLLAIVTPCPGRIRNYDNFAASSLHAVPDLDGDGYPELAAGANGDGDPLESSFESQDGAVHLLFLGDDGTLKDSLRLADRNSPSALNLLDSNS
eukprot:6209164-Pleurochrysis_carterae.AAC.2